LLTLIRKNSNKFYDCVIDLCLEGLFRSQGYENTLLLPGDKLVEHIANLIESDKDDEAIKIIKSLILIGHYKTKDSLASAKVVGTLDGTVLKKPSDVASECSDTKLKTFGRNGEEAVFVLKYSGAKAPECVVGEKVMPKRLGAGGKKGGAGEVSEDKKYLDDIVDKLNVNNKPEETFANFTKAVAVLLSNYAEDDKKIIHYLSANPIVSFFLLTMNGHSKAPISMDVLKEKDVHNSLADVGKLEKMMSECQFDRSLFKEINEIRNHIRRDKGDKHNLIGAITDGYHKLLKLDSPLKELFGDCPDVKILMDEIRFLYDDAVHSYDDMSYAIAHLKSINWDKCKEHTILTDSDLQKCLGKCPGVFASGPSLFVKSMYFMYIPINDSIVGALDNSKSGGSAYGSMNPSHITSAVFKGGAARKSMKKVASKDNKMKKLINSLSSEQKCELKKLL